MWGHCSENLLVCTVNITLLINVSGLCVAANGYSILINVIIIIIITTSYAPRSSSMTRQNQWIVYVNLFECVILL